MTINPKQLEEEKLGRTNQRNLISELLRLGHIPSVRKNQWHAVEAE